MGVIFFIWGEKVSLTLTVHMLLIVLIVYRVKVTWLFVVSEVRHLWSMFSF